MKFKVWIIDETIPFRTAQLIASSISEALQKGSTLFECRVDQVGCMKIP